MVHRNEKNVRGYLKIMDFLFDLALRSLSVEGDGSNHPGQGSRDEVGVIGGPSSSQSETPVTDDDRTSESISHRAPIISQYEFEDESPRTGSEPGGRTIPTEGPKSRPSVRSSMMISHRDGNENEPKTINDKELWEACRIGDLSRVQDLLRKDFSIKKKLFARNLKNKTFSDDRLHRSRQFIECFIIAFSSKKFGQTKKL